MEQDLHNGYSLSVLVEPRLLPRREQFALLTQFDRIVQLAWEVDPHIYRKEPDFFINGNCAVIFVQRGDELIPSDFRRQQWVRWSNGFYRRASGPSPSDTRDGGGMSTIDVGFSLIPLTVPIAQILPSRQIPSA